MGIEATRTITVNSRACEPRATYDQTGIRNNNNNNQNNEGNVSISSNNNHNLFKPKRNLEELDEIEALEDNTVFVNIFAEGKH
jgi:hypothetical protein